MRYLLLSLLLCVQPALAAQMYRCTNDKGTTVFQDRPCDNLQAEPIQIKVPKPASSPASSAVPADAGATATEAAGDCQQAVRAEIDSSESINDIDFEEPSVAEDSIEGGGTLVMDGASYTFTYTCQVNGDEIREVSYAVDR